MIVTPDNIVGTVCAVMLAVAFGYRVIMDGREESLARSALPPASPKCRQCNERWSSRWNKKADEWVSYPALQAVQEPEDCSIEEPHRHIKCSLCGAEYPTQL